MYLYIGRILHAAFIKTLGNIVLVLLNRPLNILTGLAQSLATMQSNIKDCIFESGPETSTRLQCANASSA